MITKTLNLDEEYQALFDEVREKSNGAINVNNLDAFYGSIQEIAAIDTKFLRLPLDEPLFEIDANSRKITVPAEFRANGISVQKDHLAEVVFFRIERYFDYTDLSTCNIVINWKMGNQEGKTTRFIKFEKVFTIDETKASCIVFGWPVNNVVTNKSGPLTFAVEFFKTDGPEGTGNVIYRFNTMPITVNVKEGLIVDENIEVVDLEDDILSTLINSTFGENDAAVGDIQWLTGDGHGLVSGTALNAADNSVIISFDPIAWKDNLNLKTIITNEGPQSIGINLIAQAFVDNSTLIQYTNANGIDKITDAMAKISESYILVEDRDALDEAKLYFIDDNGTKVAASAEDKADAEIDLYEIAPLNEDLIYYVLVPGSEPAVYSKASDEEVAAWGTANKVELYSKLAVINANKAGQYAIKAQGYKVDRNDVKIGSGEVSSTDIVTIPAPEAPKAINVEIPEFTDLDTGYSFAENIENVIFLNGEQGQGVLKASADIDNFGALQFIWKKRLAADLDFANVSEEEVPFQTENLSELVINEAGQYKVSVANFLNGEIAPAIDSAIIVASPLAGRITNATAMYRRGSGEASIVPNTVIQYNSSNNTKLITLMIHIDEEHDISGQKGILEYQWFKQNATDPDDESSVSWEPIPGATNAEFTVTKGDGVFLPVIKNNVNGSIYTYTLNSIFVDDSATN